MKVLVLAGGIPQIELIKNLRKTFTGVEVILADYTEHPAAEQYADRFYRESTLDVSAIRRIAVDEKVNLIITCCTDQALNTVADLSEELGLPCYISAETGRNVTNKRYMKQVFREYGIPSSSFIIVDEPCNRLPDTMQYPVIVKPVDCNSSKGVVKACDNDELEASVENALGFSRTHDAIVEEYIDGKELSVDVYVHEGEPEILCISESQKIRSNDRFVIFRGIYPAGIDEKLKSRIQVVVKKIVTAFQLWSCPMLVQMLYAHGEIYVVEFSARTGGGLKYQMIKQVSGVDIIEEMVRATLGKSRCVKKQECAKYVVNEFLYCEDGVFNYVEGFQELEDEGVIYNFFVFKNPGTRMSGVRSSGDRIASITFQADSFDELNLKYEIAKKRIKVISKNGRDMLRHDLSYPISYR